MKQAGQPSGRLCTPRVVVAGLSGDAGKTLVSIGLLLAARERGLEVRAFKKGPDYIDAAWLSFAAGRPAHNLDTFLAGTDRVVDSFARCAVSVAQPGESDTPPPRALNLVEGNRGLFDGVDAVGAHSTAVLAKALGAPVLLVVNARKVTRTTAAYVLGCRALNPALQLGGVILNQVAGHRHETIAREAIERETGVRVLGAIPRLDEEALPGRHLGLVPPREHPGPSQVEHVLREAIDRYVDVDRVLLVAENAGPMTSATIAGEAASLPPAGLLRVGYLTDSAFSFYYPENLEALTGRGAALVPISSLARAALPDDLDALYIGGGFPETHADTLAANTPLLQSLRRAAESGLPIYAECGGLMLLARSVSWADRHHAMAGVLPVDVRVHSRPQGHGYTVLRVDRPNPFFEAGQEIRGHEFHYSAIVGGPPDEGAISTACAVVRGVGAGEGRDALVTKCVWASYTHVHALGFPEWADGLAAAARRYARQRTARLG